MKEKDASVITVIPARYASQRLPGKPLIDLNGKTMIQRVYEQVKQARFVGKILVATDDERIMESVRSFGGNAVLTDPSLPSGSDRVAAAVENSGADIVVNVQGDEPLIPPDMIDETIRNLIETPEAGVSTPGRVITDEGDIANPNYVKVVTDIRGRAMYFSRSPIPYIRDTDKRTRQPGSYTFLKHFGLYVYRRHILEQFVKLERTPLERAEQLEQLRLLENGIWIQVVITSYESLPVDTAEDADHIRQILIKSSKYSGGVNNV
jgi:3-deoxy-manno-octulosonate cytidylyltransferase (CMP-KDO synthetase)